MNSFVICVESSHKKGMGHLFRGLNIVEFVKSKGEKYIVVLNKDTKSVSLLKEKKVLFETIELGNHTSDWESMIIDKYKANVWINDRLDTQILHAQNVKKNNIKLISLDDRGSGAEIVDINFGTLPCNFGVNLKGKKVLRGLKYLILNKEINKFKRERAKERRILVTLGGSDTYGVTIKVIKILKDRNKKADVIVGPCFEHLEELKEVADKDFPLLDGNSSLIEEFYQYDLAITAGGVTPFEANASGLPCIIVASEQHEIDNGLFLDRLGSSVFTGYHEDINTDVFDRKLDIRAMSRKGMENIKTDGIENIYREISL